MNGKKPDEKTIFSCLLGPYKAVVFRDDDLRERQWYAGVMAESPCGHIYRSPQLGRHEDRVSAQADAQARVVQLAGQLGLLVASCEMLDVHARVRRVPPDDGGGVAVCYILADEDKRVVVTSTEEARRSMADVEAELKDRARDLAAWVGLATGKTQLWTRIVLAEYDLVADDGE